MEKGTKTLFEDHAITGLTLLYSNTIAHVMADAPPTALSLAYDLLDTGADSLSRNGLLAMYHPHKDADETIVVYNRNGLDAEPDVDHASLHLSKRCEWPAEEVEKVYWASEGINPTIMAESGPVAEFCQ